MDARRFKLLVFALITAILAAALPAVAEGDGG